MAARPKHITTSVSPPVGGLNAHGAINSMPVTDAVTLINWVPEKYGVRCRKGWVEHAINLDGPIRSLLSYQPDKDFYSNRKLFAFTDTSIYNVSGGGDALLPTFTLPGITNYGRFSGAMFTNSAGSFLAACSESGGYFLYNGLDWEQVQNGSGIGTVQDADPNIFAFVTSWKRRLWFVEADSTNAWYLPTDSIYGEAKKFELGPFVKSGGRLSYITNWTIDAGEGIDDFLVFVFEGGDVLIYKGTNPDSASTFGLVGNYHIGSVPTGRRGWTTFGGDVLILSELGIQPLSYVTRGGQTVFRTSAVDYLTKIQQRVAELIGDLSNSPGWDLTLYPKENLLLLNIPLGTSSEYRQYVMNTNTNGWCVFEGMPMICMAASGDGFYFGTSDGRVCQGLTGYFDDVKFSQTEGFGIPGTIQPAYNYFGFPGRNKQFLMLRPTFMAVDEPMIDATVIVDFETPYLTGLSRVAPITGALWDVALWDQSVWGGAMRIYSNWLSTGAIGFAGTAYINTNCVGDTRLISLDYMYEPGGVL